MCGGDRRRFANAVSLWNKCELIWRKYRETWRRSYSSGQDPANTATNQECIVFIFK